MLKRETFSDQYVIFGIPLVYFQMRLEKRCRSSIVYTLLTESVCMFQSFIRVLSWDFYETRIQFRRFILKSMNFQKFCYETGLGTKEKTFETVVYCKTDIKEKKDNKRYILFLEPFLILHYLKVVTSMILSRIRINI